MFHFHPVGPDKPRMDTAEREPAPDPQRSPRPDAALLIVGHGSTVNPDSGTPTRLLANLIRTRRLFGAVAAGFWKEAPGLRDALRALAQPEVYIVPNFISEGYFTREVIPRELGLAGPLTRRDRQLLKYCPPVGSHPRMTELLLARAREAAPDASPAATALIIAAHGTGRDQNSAAAARREVAAIAGRGLYAEVACAFMAEPPLLTAWDQLVAAPTVIVVPFFIAEGLHSRQDIPELLGLPAAITPVAPGGDPDALYRLNPHRLRGRTLYYAPAVGTAPDFAEIVLDTVAAFDRAHPDPAGSEPKFATP